MKPYKAPKTVDDILTIAAVIALVLIVLLFGTITWSVFT